MAARRRRFGARDRSVLGLSLPMFAMTIAVGVVGGAVGAAYLLVLHWLQHALAPAEWGSAAEFAVLGLTGLAVVVIRRALGPMGDVELLVDNIHVSGSGPSVRALRSLVPASLLTISAGGAAGPEAPLVTTNGTLAGWFARGRRLPVSDTRCLTIAGMAAAFAVLFGAPLGAALFSLEILHRRGMEYHEALLPAIIGGLCGYAANVVLTGAGVRPVWRLPSVGTLRGVDLLWAAAAGAVGALVAVVFTYLVVGLRRVYAVVPASARPVIGGVGLAALAVWSPYALTYGEAQTAHVLTAELAAGALCVALVAKLLGSSLTIASEWPGGFIIPMFFMGATVGQLMHHAFAGANAGIVCAAVMAAANVGVTKTLLGSTLVVTEMGGLRLLPTTLLAATIALMLTSEIGLIHTQRERFPES